MIEEIKHTADVAYKVRSKSLEDLFKESAIGFYKVILGDNYEKIERNIEDTIVLEEEQLDFLLHRFLEELLYKFDVEGKIFKDIDVRLERKDNKYILKAKLIGDKYDRKKYDILVLPKAITWNNFYLKKVNGDYESYIVIDV